MGITLEKIHEDLEYVKKQITEIKEHMLDADTILTDDDVESLKEAERDLKGGKTKRVR